MNFLNSLKIHMYFSLGKQMPLEAHGDKND